MSIHQYTSYPQELLLAHPAAAAAELIATVGDNHEGERCMALLAGLPNSARPSNAALTAAVLAAPQTVFDLVHDERFADLLERIVRQRPEIALEEDAGRRQVIEVAVGACKQAMRRALLFMGRFEVAPGPPEHRSATSVVLFAKDLQEGPSFGLAVAIKLMAHRDQWEREMELRKDILSLQAQLKVAKSSPSLAMSAEARLWEARVVARGCRQSLLSSVPLRSAFIWGLMPALLLLVVLTFKRHVC